MEYEKEITVFVKTDYKSLHKQLTTLNFRIVETYQVNDIYLIPTTINYKNQPILKVLNHCLLIRDVIGRTKKLVYKYKEYDNIGSITKQAKTECEILDTKEAIALFKQLHFQELIRIFDTCIVYSNDSIELIVQLVNQKYVFIELEDKATHINKQYASIEEMIVDLERLHLDYDKSNYFVKKAELVFNDSYQK